MRRSCTASTLQRCYAIWQKSSQHSSRYLDIPFRASSWLVAFPFDCISGVPFHMLWGELRALLRVFLKKGHADSWSWRGKKTLRVLVMNMFRSTSWQVGKRGRHLMTIIWDQSHLQQSPLVDRDSPNGFWYSPIYWLVSSEVIINRACNGRTVSGLLRYDGDELVTSKYLEKELRDLQAGEQDTNIWRVKNWAGGRLYLQIWVACNSTIWDAWLYLYVPQDDMGIDRGWFFRDGASTHLCIPNFPSFYMVARVSIPHVRFPWFPWFPWFLWFLCGFQGFYTASPVSMVSMVSMVSIVFISFMWFPWFPWFLCGCHGFYTASPVSMVSMISMVSMVFYGFHGFHGFYGF